METLYENEQKLLNELQEAEIAGDKERQDVLKRMIGRLNKDMERLEEEC